MFAYVATGIASGIASLLLLPGGTAGASGAIFGLIGLMAVYGYRLGGSFGRALMRQMLIWAGIGIMFGFFIGANNVAHVGGFIAGGALGFVLAPDAPTTASSAVRWNGAAIGCIGLRLGVDVHCKTAEVGYWLGQPFWGRGIMSEVVAEFTPHAFEAFDLHRIYAEPFESNRASVRVLEKAGFVCEGRMRASIFKNGKIMDSFLYARLR